MPGCVRFDLFLPFESEKIELAGSDFCFDGSELGF